MILVRVQDESAPIILTMFDWEAMGILWISVKDLVDIHTRVYLIKCFSLCKIA